MISKVLDAELARRRLSIRAAAREIGIAHTTVNRVLQGGPYDLDTVKKIAEWLGVPPASLVDVQSSRSNELVELIPGLGNILKEISVLVTEGKVPPTFFDDIVSYARFKVWQANGSVKLVSPNGFDARAGKVEAPKETETV